MASSSPTASQSRPDAAWELLLAVDSPLVLSARSAVAELAPEEADELFEAARIACRHRSRRRRARGTGAVGFGADLLPVAEQVLWVFTGAFVEVVSVAGLEQAHGWWRRRSPRAAPPEPPPAPSPHDLDADQRARLHAACLTHAAVLGLDPQEALLLADAVLGSITMSPLPGPGEVR